MASRSPSRERYRSRTRSPTPRSDYSRRDRRRKDSRSPTRSPTRSRSPYRSPTRSRSLSRSLSRSSRSRSLTPRRKGRYRSDSSSRSPTRSRSPNRREDRRSSARGRSPTPVRSTKIVVEKLTKNVNEDHLYEIFGQFGRIKDLDLPMKYGTNRGTAFILYDDVADAEDAIAHMHEAQIDGAVISVSIVLPRRKMSPAPPLARRGGVAGAPPFQRGGRGGRFGGFGNRPGGPGGPGGPPTGPAADRFGGPRQNNYRPRLTHRSPSRSASPRPASRIRGGDRDRAHYRSRSRSRSRSVSPRRSRTPPRRGGVGRRESRDYDYSRRKRSSSRGSYDKYDDRRSRGRSRR